MVAQLILSMKKRGRRGYRNVSIEDVQSRAQALPENGVPPEIIKLLPLDNLLDKIQIQKSETPVAEPQNEEEAAAYRAVTRTNGVVLEKSRHYEIDVNAQCNAALHDLLRQLKTLPETIPLAQWKAERIEMKSGNEMLDQFQPYYFGVVFVFLSYSVIAPLCRILLLSCEDQDI